MTFHRPVAVGLLLEKTQEALAATIAQHFVDAGVEPQPFGVPRSDRLAFWLLHLLRRRTRLFYAFGFQQWGNRFRAAALLRRSVILHWIGTDLHYIATDRAARERFCQDVLPYVGAHWTVSAENAAELQGVLGIESRVVPIVEYDLLAQNPPPLPPVAGCFMYTGEGEPYESFYGLPEFLQVAKTFPELSFSVLKHSGRGMGSVPGNVRFLGWIEDMGKIYRDHAILIRLTRHDGLPKMVLEALAWGRQVVYSHPFPHCQRAHNVSEVVRCLTAFQEHGIRLNLPGRRFVAEHFSRPRVTQAWQRALAECL